MSVLADELRRLRRQAGATAVPAAAAAPAPVGASARTVAAPAEAHARDTVAGDAGAGHTPARARSAMDAAATAPAHSPLRRLLAQRAHRTEPLRRPPDPGDRALPGTELAPGLRYLERYPGLAADAGDRLDLPALAARNIEAAAGRGQLLYFDTETTGLAGGTGTRAFMIGAADWHGGRLRVRQLWLTRLAGEQAMLDAFAGWLAADTLLVSYNGRCYDAPLLATRYRLARRCNPLDGLPHLDLLHAVRRRYRGVWANCRLATVERELLAIVREDDLPGSEAPRAFLDYVRGGPATDLRRVLAHNHQDVVTLAQLLDRLLLVAPQA